MLNCCFSPSEYEIFVKEIRRTGYKPETRGFSKHVPYECPIVPCGRLVSPRHSLSHFALDHFKVDISEIFCNRPYSISVKPWNIEPNEVRCLSVLNVVAQEDVKSNENFHSGLELNKTFATCSVMMAKFKLGAETHVGDEERVLLVWSSCLCSALQLNVRIEAGHPDRSSLTSLLYEGPVKSIYTSQRPSSIYISGDCLTVIPGLLRTLTDQDQGIEIIVSYYLP